MSASRVMRRWMGLLVVFGLMGGATGCDKIKKFAEKAAKDAKEKKKRAKEDDADASLGGKLNNYVYCINHTSTSVGRASDRYYTWVDRDTGPTGKERNVYGTHDIHNVDTCKGKLEQAKKGKPELKDLEKAADEWLEALDEVEPINKDVVAYYKGKDYKDDGFKKGKELHEKYAKALDKFFEVDKVFRNAFRAKREELDKSEMARMERQGLDVALAHMKFLKQANELVEIAFHEMDTIDEGKLKAELADTQDKYDEMLKQAAKNKRQVASSWSSFASAAENYVNAAKALHRRRRDNKPLTPQELQRYRIRPGGVEGTPDHVHEMFNRMIQASNNLRWPAGPRGK